jgi:pyridoxine kinase
MPGIREHWRKEGICFDAIYTGYLGSTKQIEYVSDIFKSAAAAGCKKIVDPAMADNGKLYPGFDLAYAKAMLRLSTFADYIIPNVSEACFLTGIEYKTEITPEYTESLISALVKLGCKNVILTGIGYKAGKTGIAVYENGKTSYYEHDLLPNSCHGTGDIYASAFVGAMMRGKSAYESAKIAADYTLDAINETAKDKGHWYGARFENVLGNLISYLK